MQRNDLIAASEEIRRSVSVEDLGRANKRAMRWMPGPGSLKGVLSDADDFRRHHSKG